MAAPHPHPGPQQRRVNRAGRGPHPPDIAGPLVRRHHRGKTISLNETATAAAVLTELTQQAGAPRPDNDSNPHRSDCPPAH